MSLQQQAQQSNTVQSFFTALVTNVALLSIEVVAFTILKTKLGRIYSPRTFLPPEEKRAQELPRGPWRWLPYVIKSPPKDIIRKNGLDAYMFLRYLKMLTRIFAVFTLLTWAIIIPLDASATGGTVSGLESFAWGNITAKTDRHRFIAHLILTYLLTFFVIYMIRREMVHFVHMRHQFLISKEHSRLAQARTVLITNVPAELANEHDIRQFASFVPGGIDRVWIYRDTKEVNKMFDRRQKACKKLEKAESKYVRSATKAWRRLLAQEKKEKKNRTKDEEKVITPLAPPAEPTVEFFDSLVPRDKRPTHRTGFLGLFGGKVDTIDWCKDEIAAMNKDIRLMRRHAVQGKFLGSVFIRCNLQIGAHILAQCVSYHEPLMMYDKWLEAHPKDIVWKNLDDSALETRSRHLISWALTAGLIIFWAFPVAFVGTLSNVSSLCTKVRWLRWICKAPAPIPGIIQGVIPPALFAILFALLPIVLRGLAWFECIPRYSLISVSVYKRYFLFLLVNGFLVVTLTSGITTVIGQIIEQPTQTVQELASRLPNASVFFITYMIAQGLSGAGSALIQLGSLLLHYIRKWFLGRTPRQAYSVTFVMPNVDFGVTLPQMSLLATIGFAYSVISPIINIFAFITYMFFYIAWKFLLLQVFDQPDECETGGLYFPMAISNLFSGLYIEQICLAALYFLKIKEDSASSIVEGTLMLVLLAITAGAQILIKRSFDPITNYLPMSLATKKLAERYRKNRRKGSRIEEIDEVDLFSRDRINSARKSMRRRLKAVPKAIEGVLPGATGRLSLGNSRRSKEGGKEEDVEQTNGNGLGNGKVRESTEASGRTSGTMTEGRPSTAAAPAYAEASGVNVAPQIPPGNVNGDVKVRDMLDHIEMAHAEEPRPMMDERVVPSRAGSVRSNASKKSKASSSSKAKKEKEAEEKEKKKEEEEERVKHPTFDPPAPAGVDLTDEDETDADDADDELGEHAFDHPATYVEQPWIWVPKDTLGLSALLVKELRDRGIDASDVGAQMDAKGVVEVTRNPPDEEWSGGHDW